MELICGACRGRLLAEVPGTTVACPHCGTHLQTPAAVSSPPVDQPMSLDVEDDPVHAADSEGDTVNIQLLSQIPAGSQAHPGGESFAVESSSETSGQPVVADTTAMAAQLPSSEAETVPEIPPAIMNLAASSGPAIASPHSFAPGEGTSDLVSRREYDDTRTTLAEGFLSQFAAGLQSQESEPAEIPAAAAPAGALALDSGPAGGAPAEVFSAANATMPTDALPGISPVPSVKRDPAGRAPRPGVSRTAFVLVLSYASAMTLACAFLLYQRKMSPGTLDLPDLVPPATSTSGKTRTTQKKFLPEDRPVPEANVLKLGETRQYGSVQVTPLRVTRGPVEYSFYKQDDDDNQTKDPEGPVLKLHLRFDNVSHDQEFIPLDSVLVYTKDKHACNPHNFVSNIADRGARAKHAYALNVQPNGSWLVKNQRLDEDLAPGQSLETFIPTTAEEIESLSGALVWRFQFRKGYNRTSHRGVTTLIEVMFNSSDIVDDPPLSADPPASDPADDEPSAKSA